MPLLLRNCFIFYANFTILHVIVIPYTILLTHILLHYVQFAVEKLRIINIFIFSRDTQYFIILCDVHEFCYGFGAPCEECDLISVRWISYCLPAHTSYRSSKHILKPKNTGKKTTKYKLKCFSALNFFLHARAHTLFVFSMNQTAHSIAREIM